MQTPDPQLERFVREHQRLAVLSGAGCSTASGIPEYRDDDGNWKHGRPVQFAEFLKDPAARRRYWSRSFAGWSRVSSARPNAAHFALAELERAGRIECLITQNVDNLHRHAGSRSVIDLHGVLERVRCLGCAEITSRQRLQEKLGVFNPAWQATVRGFAPDGDARLGDSDATAFVVPDCESCGGVLKPDVVFFGEAVPQARVEAALSGLRSADALIVVGSSLMLWSGFRFARAALAAGKPLLIINRGRTRADHMARHKFAGDCADALALALRALRPAVGA